MYPDIPVWASVALLAGGLVLLAWSSDFFVSGASALAKSLGISPFIVGMVVIGFGTSAPELCVSTLSGLGGRSNLSLGNAYGSCVFNIAAILGLAAVIRPLYVKPVTAFVASPLLAATAALSLLFLSDGTLSRWEAASLLGLFAVVMPLYCWMDQKGSSRRARPSPPPAAVDVSAPSPGPWASLARLVVGLGVLVGSSHALVWGAVDFAKALGVSDLMVGLTIVAVGTSLPELASAVASARRGETEFVLGNIVGSNLFNTLAVVGLACAISPAEGFSRYLVYRDLPLMFVLSATIFLFGSNWWRPYRIFARGRLRRWAGVVWLVAFLAYMALAVCQEAGIGRFAAPRDGAQSAAPSVGV